MEYFLWLFTFASDDVLKMVELGIDRIAQWVISQFAESVAEGRTPSTPLCFPLHCKEEFSIKYAKYSMAFDDITFSERDFQEYMTKYYMLSVTCYSFKLDGKLGCLFIPSFKAKGGSFVLKLKNGAVQLTTDVAAKTGRLV